MLYEVITPHDVRKIIIMKFRRALRLINHSVQIDNTAPKVKCAAIVV